MPTAMTNNLLNVSDLRLSFGSTKLAASSVWAAGTATIFCVLLIFTSLPVQAQTETVLYRFPKDGLNGKSPQSHLTSDGKGNFFGTTNNGGLSGYGTVFEVSPDGGHGHRPW